VTDLPPRFRQALEQDRQERARQGLTRQRRAREFAPPPFAILDGRSVINFCSNDYLGLSGHPALIKATREGLDEYGLGSGASQLVCGYSAVHKELEERLAEHTGRSRAVLFSNGYMANLAIIDSLLGKGDCVFGDRLNHASLIDAARLSRAVYKRYPHGDVNALTRLLQHNDTGKALVSTDAVFSMDGDIAPLKEMVHLCTEHGALLSVDDAHGFGVLGRKGAGTLEQLGLGPEQVPLLMATFGKALGGFGAFVAGDELIIDNLVQRARTLIYTTAPPPALAKAALRALTLLTEEAWRREKLSELTEHFIQGAREHGLPLAGSTTPIQPVILGTAAKAVMVSRQLLERGFWVTAIRPPTVPQGTSRLRITLSAAHEIAHIDALLDALVEVLGQEERACGQ